MGKTRTQLQSERHDRERIVMDLLEQRGQITVDDVVEVLGCKSRYASTIMREMSAAGLVRRAVQTLSNLSQKHVYTAGGSNIVHGPWVPENGIPLGRYYP